MKDPRSQLDPSMRELTREEMVSSIFASMVIQTTNMAMMMLGKMAHPDTGEFYHEPESAKMFIDQLEMLEVKTKGNLNRQEDALLKQGLSALRMAYVELVGGVAPAETQPSALPTSAPVEQTAPPPPAPAATPEVAPTTPPVASEAAPEESRKKFSKKY